MIKSLQIFNLEIIGKISTSSHQKIKAQAFNKDDKSNGMKIPKCNPLSQMKKNFNKFDPIPNNNDILVK